MGFPRQVNVVAAPAVAGDFASTNPRATVDASYAAFIAGAAGLIIGHFAWADSANQVVNSYGAGAPSGFVHRDQQAIISAYLADDTMVQYPGSPATLFNAGDFWVKNDGSTTTTIGMTAYADNSTGKVVFGTSAPTSGTCTSGTLAKIVSASTGAAIPATAPSFTGSISGTTLTVTAVAAGTVVGAGQVLSGGSSTVGYVDTNTTVLANLTGTNGGIGTYSVSISQNVASTTITASGGCMTLTGGNTTGVFDVGMTLAVASSGSLTAGTTITALVSATAGGAGTYLLNQPAATAVTAGTITASSNMFLTVDATSTGVWAVGDLLVSSGLNPANTVITETGLTNPNLTGIGGAGTYITNGYQTAIGAQAFSVNSGTATKWVASSIGAAGELVKMTSWLNG